MTHLRMNDWKSRFFLSARMSFSLSMIILLVTSQLLPVHSFLHSPGLAIATSLDSEQLSQLKVATTAHDQARTLFKNGQYLKALPLAQQVLALRESVLGSTHVEVATALTTLGLIHHQRTELTEAESLLKRALTIHQSNLGPNHQKVGESLTNLSRVYNAQGLFTQASTMLGQSLKIQERILGHSHPDVAVSLTHLAIALRDMSRLEDAHKAAKRAVTILEELSPSRPIDLAIALSVNGNILGRFGDFENARSFLEKSLHLREQILGPSHPHVARSLTQLGLLEKKMGNYHGALPLLKRALAINEKSFKGSKKIEVAGSLIEIARIEHLMGNIAKVQIFLERALTIQEATIGLDHPFSALTLIELAEVKRQQGDHSVAAELLQRALNIQQEAFGLEHTSVAQTLTRLGYLEAQNQQLASAKSYFSRAVEIRQKALGPSHRDGAASLLDLARAEHALGQFAAARSLYERARQILQAQLGLNPGLDDEALSRIWKLDLKGLQDYSLLLAMIAKNSPSSPDQQSAVAEGFTVSQQARGWLMQAAVANALAQQAIESTVDKGLVKQVEELRRTRQEVWTRLNQLYGLSEDQRSTGDVTAVKQQLHNVQQKLAEANTQLNVEAPRYAELSQPTALDLDSAQQLLRTHEALVSFSTLGDRLQIWLLRADHPVVYRQVSIPQAKLKKLVQKIRASSESASTPYDVESAEELFQILFGPILSSLREVDHLILVPDEVLLPLPFGALITNSEGSVFSRLGELYRRQKKPLGQNLRDYASLPWLAQSYPLTILPSASALKLLRQNPVTQQDLGEPFLGFGDPILRGQGQLRGGKMLTSRGMRVAMDSLHALNRLPGTREELLTVASILHVDPDHTVYLGSRATETEVRRLNKSGRLGQAKVLAFSTHGLLAGEVRGVTQPALVLTPPDVATDENDGLLSMEDILQLKLPNTDWVILSACNTAGDDGSGESLSGLARAFFFAGAKALLVSQWSVDDAATKTLMSEIFKRYGSVRHTPPAEALREGMLALLKQATTESRYRHFAHLYAWAAFSLVGDSTENAHPNAQ